VKINDAEEHCCGEILPVEKFLQIGKGKGRYILVVAESPAANGWRKSGKAFHTIDDKILPTGKSFLENLRQIDDSLTLGDISFTEISKCFIAGNRHKLEACAKKTWPHFLTQIKFANPKLIIIMGKKTTDIFNSLSCTDLKVGELSVIVLDGSEYHVLPIYHPSPANPSRVLNKEFIDLHQSRIRELLE
jgi:uracil-DNA glycosylase family 4